MVLARFPSLITMDISRIRYIRARIYYNVIIFHGIDSLQIHLKKKSNNKNSTNRDERFSRYRDANTYIRIYRVKVKFEKEIVINYRIRFTVEDFVVEDLSWI